MPNGWHPVTGLDVLLINRTEQRYPRFEYNQSFHEFWAVEFMGTAGYAPQGQFRVPRWPRAVVAFDLLVEATRQVLLADERLTGRASVVFLDFASGVGWAAGSYCAYGFTEGGARILHDHSLGTAPGADPTTARGTRQTWVDTSGLNRSSPEVDWRFDFKDMDSVVVASSALHYDVRWPPSSSVDCVAFALACDGRKDELVAVWSRARRTASSLGER